MKKNYSLYLLLVGLLLCQDLIAQKKLKREISVFAMPMVGTRIMSIKGTPSDYNGNSADYKDSIQQADFPKLALGGGVGLSFYRDVYTRLEVGLRYSDQGFTRGKYDLGFGEMIHPEIGPVKDLSQTGSPKDVHFIYRYQYLQIPVVYHFAPYSVKKYGKFDFYMSAGLSVNVLLNHTVKAKYQGWSAYGKTEQNITNHEYDPSPANLNLHFGFRLHYNMDSRTELLVSPALGMGVLNANNGNERPRLIDFSVPIGFTYRLSEN